MSIFDLLTMIGGLCLFLFGMDVMGKSLERSAGNKLRDILGKFTTNKIAGFLTGVCVTAVIQSSSATTVMVVGFVNSGIMNLSQATNVILGANLGTSVTAWILSLSGISGDGNILIQMLKPSSFTPILALIGIILYMFNKSERKKNVGAILLGFATLMYGMETMSASVSGLSGNESFSNILTMFDNPILGMFTGLVLTAIIQSSSASVGILQALSSTGAISLGAAIPIIMGQNIGTCITALLSAIGANKNAKRAALVHLTFNVLGTVVWLTLFCITQGMFTELLATTANPLNIAICHSTFKILCLFIFLPLSSILEKIANKLIPDTQNDESICELDERILATPPIALQQCRTLTNEMALCSVRALKISIEMLAKYTKEGAAEVRKLEEKSDHFEDVLGSYLVKLSSKDLSESDTLDSAMLLKSIGDFERISDHSVNILESVEELKEKSLEFSKSAQNEIDTLTSAIKEILDKTVDSFINGNLDSCSAVEPLEQVIDGLKEELRSRHIQRLQQSGCSIEAGFVWNDLLTNFERVSDHCSNIAGGVIDRAQRTMNIHESLRMIKESDTHYKEVFENYKSKYSLKQN